MTLRCVLGMGSPTPRMAHRTLVRPESGDYHVTMSNAQTLPLMLFVLYSVLKLAEDVLISQQVHHFGPGGNVVAGPVTPRY